MTSGVVLWLWVAGLVYFVLGLIAVRKELRFSNLPVLGRAFAPLGLGMFGAEHLSAPRVLAEGVPKWMPAHLFWSYLVGFALIAAATSIALNRFARLAASLLGLMFILFVLMIHGPNVVANPHNRFLWAVATRETAFACGALIFARRFPALCRIALGLVLVFFAVEHFLHPEFIPGVPLGKLTPEFIPARELWGYVTGLALLTGGAALLVNKYVRSATTLLGMVLIAMVVFLYLPILAAHPKDLVEALNYIGDTSLFAGLILLASQSSKDS